MEYRWIQDEVAEQFGIDLTAEGVDVRELTRHEIGESLFEKLKERYAAKERRDRREADALP